MYILRKIGFYVTLVAIGGGTLGVLVMLLLGVSLTGADDGFGLVFGAVFLVLAILLLIVIGIIAVLLIFYQRSIVVPLIFLLIFGITSINLASEDTPVFFITLGLTIGPALTIIGYFFKKPEDTSTEQAHSEEVRLEEDE